MRINLHIERLVLEGLPLTPQQGPLVQMAVESELARLFAANGVAPELTSGGLRPHAPGGAVQFTAGATPRQLGTQIAQSVHEGLAK